MRLLKLLQLHRVSNSPVLIKNLLRWSKISMLDTYGHVMTDEKIAAQGSILERIMPKTNVVQ